MVCLPVFRKLGSKSTAAGVGCHWPVDVEVVTSLTCCPCWASDCQHTSTESSSAWPGFSLKYPAGPWPGPGIVPFPCRSEEHTSELQSHSDLVCRLLLEKKKKKITSIITNMADRRKMTSNESIRAIGHVIN